MTPAAMRWYSAGPKIIRNDCLYLEVLARKQAQPSLYRCRDQAPGEGQSICSELKKLYLSSATPHQRTSFNKGSNLIAFNLAYLKVLTLCFRAYWCSLQWLHHMPKRKASQSLVENSPSLASFLNAPKSAVECQYHDLYHSNRRT